jgi:hypothetical protein
VRGHRHTEPGTDRPNACSIRLLTHGPVRDSRGRRNFAGDVSRRARALGSVDIGADTDIMDMSMCGGSTSGEFTGGDLSSDTLIVTQDTHLGNSHE